MDDPTGLIDRLRGEVIDRHGAAPGSVRVVWVAAVRGCLGR